MAKDVEVTIIKLISKELKCNEKSFRIFKNVKKRKKILIRCVLKRLL